MQTVTGYVYICKECKNIHVIPLNSFDENENNILVNIVCPKKEKSNGHIYERNDFKVLVGDYKDINRMLVIPSSIERYNVKKLIK